MEPVTGALAAGGKLLQGAVAFAVGITHPTLPLKANLVHITSVTLPRSHHTLSVVKGRAYIFGGETSPGVLANNDMHIVILPSSGVLEADYTSRPARPAQAGGEVPAPRKGHSAVVIGHNIYIVGGEGVQDEKGRVWIYNTLSNTWTHLDSAPGTPYPSHRSGHSAASSELPGPKDEVVYRERAPQSPVDPAKAVPEPADPNTWGTIFIVGGKDIATGEIVSDGMAFDVRTRTWSSIPSPPGRPRAGATMVLVGNRLYRFGGKGIEELGNSGLEHLDVSSVWRHAEGGTAPLTTGWAWDEVWHTEGEQFPQPRSRSGLEVVTTGQGRHYLLALGGHGADDTLLQDIWAFQLPSEKATAASAKDATRSSVKAGINEGVWSEAVYKYVDARGEESEEGEKQGLRGIGSRGHFASAKGTEVDGASVVVWGGVDSNGQVLGDGWLVTVDR